MTRSAISLTCVFVDQGFPASRSNPVAIIFGTTTTSHGACGASKLFLVDLAGAATRTEAQ